SAALAGDAETLGRLLDQNPELVLSDRPIGWAAFNPQGATLALLADRGADLDARSRFGDTPLIVAAMRGNLPGVKALLTRGADLGVRNASGFDARRHAAYFGHFSTVRYLIQRYGQPYDIHTAAALGDVET